MLLIVYPIGVVGQILLIPFHVLPHTDIVSILLNAGLGIAGGIAGGIAVGLAGGIAFGYSGGIAFGYSGGIAVGIAGGITFGITFGIGGSIGSGIAVSFVGSVASGIAIGIAGGIAVGLTLGVDRGTSVGLTIGPAVGIAVSFAVGGAIIIGLVSVVSFAVLAFSIIFASAIGLSFTVCYFIGFYRLPFFLVSGPSAFRAYRASYMNSSGVFAYLQRSSLHWDEIVYLPLPFLKQTLLIAYDQDAEKALNEITFIAADRPPQLRVARAALLEIAVRDLEQRKTMSAIAGATPFLDELFPQETKLLASRWSTPITRLREASLDAARFCSPVGRRARLEALQDMIKHMKEARLNTPFGDTRVLNRLTQVVNGWLLEAEQQKEMLEQLPDYIGRIDNPYNPGNTLKPNDPLFFGRMDLVQVLQMELDKGERRPTFLMTGERRMGKSSTLQQLPRLLGSRFLPIFYDLQRSGILASTPTFLATLAEGIHKEMHARSMPVKMLEYRTLRRRSPSDSEAVLPHEEEASVAYEIFNRWLKDVESLLEQENRTLLLLFDEFEKLEEAGLKRAFDLPLLLDWLRSTIQYRPRIALLFSGVHTISEMGQETGLNWSGYFVNVQTLRVSFLHEDEARRLITYPVPGFPGADIYGDGVVDRILTETGFHPFLVQAVCSALIDCLNTKKQDRAQLKDVITAIDLIFTNWSNYFRDLWIRTDKHQRSCLLALRALNIADKAQIQQQAHLDEKTAWRTLETLVKRDLIHKNEDDTYNISTPIFSQWVERSRYAD
jgi:hypothetical protein